MALLKFEVRSLNEILSDGYVLIQTQDKKDKYFFYATPRNILPHKELLGKIKRLFTQYEPYKEITYTLYKRENNVLTQIRKVEFTN